MRVLVVDDEPEVLTLVGQSLERDGHVVSSARSIAESRAALARQEFDVMVIDIGLPDGSGLRLCEEVRAMGVATRVLMLTAQAEVGRRIAGFSAGADDFVAKPFSVAELRARVRALGRRTVSPSSVRVTIGEVHLDFASRNATAAGRRVLLTGREWAILDALAGANGRVLPRQDLVETVWGDDDEGARHSLEVLVSRIRRKLGSDVLRTVRGEGYALGGS